MKKFTKNEWLLIQLAKLLLCAWFAKTGWNGFFKSVFGLSEIDFWQALGALLFVACVSCYRRHDLVREQPNA